MAGDADLFLCGDDRSHPEGLKSREIHVECDSKNEK